MTPRVPPGLFTRDFRLFFAAQGASLLGDGLFTVALAFAVLDLTGSERSLGIVFAAGAIPLVAFSLVGGVWADRVERRRLMVGSDAVRAAALLILAALVTSGDEQLWQFIALQAVYGTAQAFFGPAATGMLPQILEADLLQPANGFLGATRAAMFVAGSALGGLIVDRVGPGAAIGLDSLVVAFSALCLLLMRTQPPPAREHNPQFMAELREGFRELRQHRWLWLMMINVSLFLMLYVAPLQILGPVVSRDDLGGAVAWGILGAALSLGEIVGGILAATARLSYPMACAGGLFLVTGLTPVLLALPAPLWVIAVAMGVEGVAIGLFLAVWEGALQRRIPNDKLSRVSAWDWMASLAGMPIGFVLGGVLADTVGVDQTLYGMAVVGFVLSLMILLVRDLREIGSTRSGIE